ncbi:unnamed protein product [Timema podura]|uniref:Uncharacterized protein n=1 Tax=Timema podura TaxID=61482 RepID=A0ABN7NSS7_TIMPD|nr:unnamed protein product [Timema podura]
MTQVSRGRVPTVGGNKEQSLSSLYQLLQAALHQNQLQQQQQQGRRLEEAGSETLYPVLPAAVPLIRQPDGLNKDEDKRGSYMSLCHFKICNMGRKRNLRGTFWSRIAVRRCGEQIQLSFFSSMCALRSRRENARGADMVRWGNIANGWGTVTGNVLFFTRTLVTGDDVRLIAVYLYPVQSKQQPATFGRRFNATNIFVFGCRRKGKRAAYVQAGDSVVLYLKSESYRTQNEACAMLPPAILSYLDNEAVPAICCFETFTAFFSGKRIKTVRLLRPYSFEAAIGGMRKRREEKKGD